MSRLTVIFTTIVLLLGGCGVHVGNGMRGFESKYGFKFEYPESLGFQSANDGRNLSLDNSALAEKAGQDTPVSTTKIEVEHIRGIADAEAVRRYAQGREPLLRDFVVQKFGDAFGVAQTYLSSERLTSTVYFYTKAEAMVRMVIDAYGAANGVELMSPVLKSAGGSGNYQNPERIWPDAGWILVPEREEARVVPVNGNERLLAEVEKRLHSLRLFEEMDETKK